MDCKHRFIEHVEQTIQKSKTILNDIVFLKRMSAAV